MSKIIYLALAAQMIAFALCVYAFTVTSDIFQYPLAVFNLVMLFNTLRIAVEMKL